MPQRDDDVLAVTSALARFGCCDRGTLTDLLEAAVWEKGRLDRALMDCLGTGRVFHDCRGQYVLV